VAVSKEEVEALIDSKLDSFLEKIGSMIIQVPKEKADIPEPKIKSSKSSFACPICGEVFRSGFQVGAHKKEKHSN
jgi:hypothetical protein